MKNRKAKEREALLEELLPNAASQVWPSPDEKGWFKGPRPLPVILVLVNTKALRGKIDISSTYIALLAENRGEGLVEIRSETEFAMLSGFSDTARGLRMWRERMRVLEKLGLIRAFQFGRQAIGRVIMMHPYAALEALQAAGKLDPGMWTFYRAKLLEAGVTPVASPARVVPIRAGRRI